MIKVNKLEGHPAAECFPMMGLIEFNQLKDDILENDQNHPIIVYKGQILDGRNRYKACLEAGIEPRLRYVDDLEIGGDPVAYVLSCNKFRRHLTPSQLSAVAVNIEKLYSDSKWDPETAMSTSGQTSAELAGRAIGVSAMSVKKAKKVSVKGDPEVLEAVRQGELSVNAASYLVDSVADHEEQRKIVKEASAAGSTKKAGETVRKAISGGVTFDVDEIEAAGRFTKNGRPIGGTSAQWKQCQKHWRSFVKVFHSMGYTDSLHSAIEAIAEVVESRGE